MVLGHRGNLKKVEMLLAAKQSAELLFCLRIATIVAHARQEIELPKLEATFHGHSFCLYVPRDHPVVEYLLEEEKATWAKVDYQFDLIAI